MSESVYRQIIRRIFQVVSERKPPLFVISTPSAGSGQAHGEILNYLFSNKISRRYATRNDILTQFSFRH